MINSVDPPAVPFFIRKNIILVEDEALYLSFCSVENLVKKQFTCIRTELNESLNGLIISSSKYFYCLLLVY